jgi:hypothetical protein
VADGRRALAARIQRLHGAQRDPRAERVVPRQLPPPLGRAARIALRLARHGQLLQRARVRARKAVALLLGPALELGGVGHGKAVQEGAAVRRHRPFRIVRVQRRQEVGQVAAHHGRVQRQLVARAHEQVLAHPLAQDVERFGEQVARRVAGVLGPQVADEPLAPHHAPPRRGEQGEQRQAPPVHRPSGDRHPAPLQGGSSQHLQHVHRHGYERVDARGKEG